MKLCPVGDDSFRDQCVRFCLWALELHRLPTAREVQARMQCSRMTAYRWLRTLKDARGMA